MENKNKKMDTELIDDKDFGTYNDNAEQSDKISPKDLDLHAKWLRNEPDGVRLITPIGAVESSANLSGADLDFASWPLWCGSRAVRVDRRVAAQLVAHICALDCADPDYQALRELMLPFARTSHRARELGLLE